MTIGHADYSLRPTSTVRAGLEPSRLIIFGFAILVLCDILDAYSLLGIPFAWIGTMLAFPIAILFGLRFSCRVVPGTSVFGLLLLWLIVNTYLQGLSGDFYRNMPALATTSYPVFISLRFLTFIVFIINVHLIFNLCVRDAMEDTTHEQAIVKIIVWFGVAASLFAIYVYVAQKAGLWEPPRTRFGTGVGGTHSSFYQIRGAGTGETIVRRATGSFREPSDLAVWLIVPFFLSFVYKPRLCNPFGLFIGATILLTLSLTTVISIPLGYIGAVMMHNPFRPRNLMVFAGMTLLAGGVIFVLNSLIPAGGTGQQRLGLALATLDRIENIIEGGVQASNRDYVFEWLSNSEFSLYGLGLGNANIEFSGDLLASFLSLYVNTWFAGGAIGLTALIVFLMVPLVLYMFRRDRTDMRAFWYLGAYITWLIVFVGKIEALYFMFAVNYALLISRVGIPREASREA